MLVAAMFIGWCAHDDDNGQWRERAETMIDKHRKAEFSIRVVDRKGQPVPHAKIEAAMTRTSPRTCPANHSIVERDYDLSRPCHALTGLI